MAVNAALVAIVCFAALAVAYFTYGRFLAQRVFKFDDKLETPAHTVNDGVDYVPTNPAILFGHHFASIAGLGPILGPALAVSWGWAPAILWIVVGCVFIGAVHDLGSMAVSLRHQGRSIGDLCRELMGPRARLLFLLIIFFAMSVAMGAFVVAISDLFLKYYPTAVLPSFGLMLVAVAMGLYVYKYNGSIKLGTTLSLIAFGALIIWGVEEPIGTYNWFTSAETAAALEAGKAADPAKGPAFAAPYGSVAAKQYLEQSGDAAAAGDLASAERTAYYWWVAVLLAYGFIASVLPVWLLLQPRDYINSFQLYAALGMLLAGLLIAAATGSPYAEIHAPAFRPEPDPSAPPLFPFITVTIACGAVSGFHSLVASGTTVRQLDREKDALPIGYGGMLVEGALAVLVVLACTAGLGAAAWGPTGQYSDWSKVSGLAAGLSTVCDGGANFLAFVGMPVAYGRAFIAVTVVAFALTTLDSATRLLRFNVEEIFKSIGLARFADRYTASLIAVAGIAVIALVPAGRTLWTMFGSVNQLLASLALTAVSVFLYQLNRPVIYTIIPAGLMLASTTWAMCIDLAKHWKNAFSPAGPGVDPNASMLLGVLTLAMLGMTGWMLVEAALAFGRGPRGPELLKDKPRTDEPPGEVVAATHVG